MNQKDIGVIAENEVMTALSRCGVTVSIPRGDNDTYDLVADINGRLYKIQVKSAIPRYEGSIDIHTVKSRRPYEDGDVDYFATTYKGKCYLIPYEGTMQVMSLRLEPVKYDYRKRLVRMAEDYELERVVYELMTT